MYLLYGAADDDDADGVSFCLLEELPATTADEDGEASRSSSLPDPDAAPPAAAAEPSRSVLPARATTSSLPSRTAGEALPVS